MSLQKLSAQFDDYMRKIDQKARNEDYKSVEATEKNLGDLKILLNDSNKIKGEIEKEYLLLSPERQKESSFKVKSIKTDYDLRKTSVGKIEEKLKHTKNLNELMMNGSNANLSKEEIRQSSREAILELHNKTDQHERLLLDIKSDVVDTRTNLKGMAFQVKQDTETLNRVQNNLQDSNKIVKRTDMNITHMQRREFCHKLLLHAFAFLLLVLIIISIAYKINRKI